MITAHAIARAVWIDDRELVDDPAPDGLTDADLRGRLLRLLRLDQQIHRAAGEASDLGLTACWIRIEGVDDDVDAAIAAVRAELARRATWDGYADTEGAAS